MKEGKSRGEKSSAGPLRHSTTTPLAGTEKGVTRRSGAKAKNNGAVAVVQK